MPYGTSFHLQTSPELLLNQLLTTEEQIHAYDHNAAFHAGVTMVVTTLPLLVEGMRVAAQDGSPTNLEIQAMNDASITRRGFGPPRA